MIPIWGLLRISEILCLSLKLKSFVSNVPVKLFCESKSINNVLLLFSCKYFANWKAIVVFPTPPLIAIKLITCIPYSPLSTTLVFHRYYLSHTYILTLA